MEPSINNREDGHLLDGGTFPTVLFGVAMGNISHDQLAKRSFC